MRIPQFIFYRGSTPTLELELPMALTGAETAWVTLSQQGQTVLDYAMHAQGQTGEGSLSLCDTDPCLLLVQLTQADTLALDHGDCELQLRLRTADGADTFAPCFGWVGQARRKGEI